MRKIKPQLAIMNIIVLIATIIIFTLIFRNWNEVKEFVSDFF